MLLRRSLLLSAAIAIGTPLAACGGGPVLTDRDAGPSDASAPPVDSGRGDAGPPPVDAGPPCVDRDPTLPADPTAGAWDRRFANPGVGGDLPNVEAFAFGSGGTVYVGGDFTTAGYAPASNVAAWDGATGWRALGDGLSGRVRALAVDSGDRLWAAYAPDGGWEATRLARWDGTSWATIADAEGGTIETLALVGDVLVVGGGFTRIGGADLAGLARLDLAAATPSWSGWAELAPDGRVMTISATSLEDLCIGGEFHTLGVVETFGGACWDGAAWSARSLPLPFYSGIFSMTRDPEGGALIAAGNFMLADTTEDGGSIARWAGDRWELIGRGVMSELGPGTTKDVRGVVFTTSGMYVGGAFGAVHLPDGPAPMNAVARWDGARWHDLGGLFAEVGFILGTNNVQVVAAGPDGSVYFGGLFTRAGTTRVAHVVRWDGTYWSALRTPGETYEGVGGSVLALAREDACAIYVGGEFDYAGGVRANGIARYTRAGGYEALGEGVVGYVNDIALFDDGRVVAGGTFTDPTGTAFRNVALWDGSEWSALGGSVEGDLWAVAVDESESPDERDLVYVGGSFERAGDADARGVAVWDGETWSAVGGGLHGWPYEWDPTTEAQPYPYDMLVDPATGDLIVAGTFQRVGESELVVNNVARWDGTSWHAYGEGLGDQFGSVHAIAFWNGQLVASGAFSTSGTTEVGHVARWNGTAWERVGATSLDGFAVSALQPVGDALYVGGMFSIVEGGPSAHVAVLDGDAWVDLDAGVSDVVEALAWMDEGIYFGGTFDRAGSSPAVGLALWQFEGRTP